MRVDLKQSIVDIDGKKALRTDDDKVFNLRKACVSALLNPAGPMDGEKKMTLFKLADRINREDSADFSVEELAQLKSVIGDRFAPLIVGRCYEMLDPSSNGDGK